MIAEARRPRCELFWNNGAMNTVRDDRRHHFHPPRSSEFTTQLAGQRFWRELDDGRSRQIGHVAHRLEVCPGDMWAEDGVGSPSRGLSGQAALCS